ncbi:MAG TPA: MFS transporter [Gammaproteobacteria bacterium]|nr:MFS transporter [Gammaproteobacteria bacterium]
MKPKLPFFTLLLMISFASVNAVLFTPALPNIAHFFDISAKIAQQTITWFLIGYALGQLVYGPIANRFGRKPALYTGITLQILASLLCVFAGVIHQYWVLVLARFLCALGAGVGLKMTFTLVNECYDTQAASQKISHLILAFAITPGLGVALGGILNTYYGWESCFYAGVAYGIILLFFVMRLPETQTKLNLHALEIKHLLHAYGEQFKNSELVLCGLLMGGSACFIYVFAALAPFIAIKLFGMSSAEYGLFNIIPAIGLILGSLVGSTLPKKHALKTIIKFGIGISTLGVLLLFAGMLLHLPIVFSLFLPCAVLYFGSCFIMSNASGIAMSHVTDKSHGAAVMSFINMSTATVGVLSLGLFTQTALLLPCVYIVLCIAMMFIFKQITPATTSTL